MKISYSWLKEYVDVEMPIEELSHILTQTGLEVGGLEEVETVKGGLRGLVIGEVVSCVPHSDSDHLSVTTVNVGEEDLLPIVCGAPNVAAGQKVVVATVGTTLYDGDSEFKIKKSKIRGEVSMGMICAEDEIGLGAGHDGIMVLDESAVPGTPASSFFNVESDFVIDIDLTPNRIDGGSHIGVARDIAAFLKQSGESSYRLPSVDNFAVDSSDMPIDVVVESADIAPRYAGVTVKGVTVAESPEWLRNRLKVIGLSPINNIVDITNYVLFELGQPLHAFDIANIKGGKIVVKKATAGEKFTTLDAVERELNENDLMICNESEPMCIAGVFGGLDSGVKEGTTDIFLESAYFNPVSVRKSARRHGLNTDASFRFERGIDPNITIFALKRAASLIKEIAGGTISSEIVDIISDSSILESFPVTVSYENVTRLIGENIGEETIKKILIALEMEIVSEADGVLEILVPPYRVDVKREADVIEDILRIYGFNTIKPGKSVKSTIQYSEKPDKMMVQNMISDMLSGNGFNEIWCNSLTKFSYYEGSTSYPEEKCVKIFNPLSQDHNSMRQTLLFGGLEAVERNRNFRNSDLALYEFGHRYIYNKDLDVKNPVKRYSEDEALALWISGDASVESWVKPNTASTFYRLKGFVDNILVKIGLSPEHLRTESVESDIYSDAFVYKQGREEIVTLGVVAASELKKCGVNAPVFYAEFNWTTVMRLIKRHKVSFKPLSKYPEVRRDLSLLIDKSVTFSQLKDVAKKVEKRLLKRVDIFDVYQGDKLPEGKKSYALSFILRDEEKTLKDKQIDKVMQKMIKTFEKELGASLR